MDSIADGLLHAVTLATAAGVTLWAAGAIYFDACRGAGWGRWVAAGWVAGVVALFALWQPLWRPFVVLLGVFALLRFSCLRTKTGPNRARMPVVAGLS